MLSLTVNLNRIYFYDAYLLFVFMKYCGVEFKGIYFPPL